MGAAMSRVNANLKRLLKIRPYQHQTAAASKGMACLEEHGSFALLHDMGAGKTLTTLGMFAMLVDDGRAETMLVVCPASVIGSWERECQSLPVECLPLTGAVAKREAALQRRLLEREYGSHLPLIVVTNYEAVWRMEALLRVSRFDMIVCDESQRIKAPGSKQTRAMQRIGESSKYRVILSGTPVPEGPLGFFSQYKYLDPSVFGSSYANFKAKYAVEKDFGTFRKVVAMKNLDELEMRVMERAHRVSKEDALDLPDETDVIRTFDLSPSAKRIYDQLAAESVAAIEDVFGEIGEVVAENVLTRLLRLQQITSGFAQLDEQEGLLPVDDGKIKLLKDVLEDLFDAGQKVVIFHRFRADGEAIRALLAKMGVGFVFIDGSVSTGVRGPIVDEFQNEDKCVAFVGQIASSGLGITLTAASTSIFYSTGYSGADYEQARARIHRIGQHYPVTHIHLVAKGTVDEHVISALREKRRIAEDVTCGAWKRYFERRND